MVIAARYAAKTMGIYVEIFIRGAMDEVWDKTQNHKLHQRWDLRFSEIEYLTCPPGEPQRFLYATRIGAGLRIEGAGESVGEYEARTGQRTSALKFWSDDRKSLIQLGSGYWKYLPVQGGIQFFTAYDYRTRFGALGSIIDKLVFRPQLGWATAWSFDRLRLWIEHGVSPEVSRNQFVLYALARLTVAFVWLYHGLVPKLIYRDSDELKMLSDAGVQAAIALRVMLIAGWAEVGLAAILVWFWRSRWPLWATLLFMIVATAAVSLNSPEYLTAAFNPVTLNASVGVLAAIALVLQNTVPSADRCRRTPARS